MGFAAPWDFPVTIYLYICVFIRDIALLLVDLCLFLWLVWAQLCSREYQSSTLHHGPF